MPFYPCSKEQQRIIDNFQGGNFGLWYNKYVPLIPVAKNYELSVCNPEAQDSKESAADFYLSRYEAITPKAPRYLKKKHINQVQYCRNMQNIGFFCLAISVRLKSPLLCGVGHTHPSETSLTFDHNLGIPYIPASSAKGLVRFGYLLNYVRDNTDMLVEKESINEEDETLTLVPEMFGIQAKRGKIVFLDAYPVNIPELKLDILNPHYKDYYQNDPPSPPADNQDPIPVRFLTVAPGAEFVFRAVLNREVKDEVREQCLQAYKRILTEEGVGSKTSLGYGLFEWLDEKEHPKVEEALREEEARIEQQRQEAKQKREQEKLASMSPDDRQIYKIQKLENDSEQISELCQECLQSDFSPEVFQALKGRLQELGVWNPKKATKNKSRQQKLQKRNEEIEKRIGYERS